MLGFGEQIAYPLRLFVSVVLAASAIAWALRVVTADGDVAHRADMMRSNDPGERLSGLLDLSILTTSDPKHAANALPLIFDALDDPDRFVRAQALIALSDFASHASALGLDPKLNAVARRIIIASLEDPVPEVRGAAVGSIGRLGPVEASALPLLIHMTGKHEFLLTRTTALTQLGRYGEPSRGAHLAVLAAMEDREPLVRMSAVTSLGKWVGSDLNSARVALGSIDDPDLRVREAAFESLRQLRVPSVDLLPTLSMFLQSDDVRKATVGAELVRRMGRNGRSLSAALWAAHQRFVAGAEVSAFIDALASVAPDSVESRAAVESLTSMLAAGPPTSRARAANALAAFGPFARAATDALRSASETDDPPVNRAASEALRRISERPEAESLVGEETI